MQLNSTARYQLRKAWHSRTVSRRRYVWQRLQKKDDPDAALYVEADETSPTVRTRYLRKMSTVYSNVRTEFAADGSTATWFETEIADGWVVSYLIVPQNGHPVPAEMRVRRGTLDASEHVTTELPLGGLPSTLIHSISVKRHMEEALRWLQPEPAQPGLYEAAEYVDWDIPELLGFTRFLEDLPARSGRRQLSDEFCAIVSALYLRAREEAPKRPVSRLVELLKELPRPHRRYSDRQTASNLLQTIKRRGFREPDGALTEKATAVLRKLRDRGALPPDVTG